MLLALALLCLLSPRTKAAVAYTITDLGTVDGYGLNNQGQVAGVSYAADGLQRAFFYNGTTMADLGTLGGLESGALGLNSTGQLVGWSDTTNGTQHAFLYSAGTLTDLGTLGGSNSYALAISDSGYIAGWSETTSSVAHAFLYRSGVMTDLGPGYAVGVNTNGQATGWSIISSVAWHAFLYSGTNLADLGTLGGPVSEGLAINNSGQIAGWSALTNGAPHAFLYNGGVMTDLGTLSGTNSRATALNNNGQVVGSFDTNDLGGVHAFRYAAGTATDLNSLISTNDGWVLTDSVAINDQGSILVLAIRPGDLFHTLLLTPATQSTAPVLAINLVGNSLIVSWLATVTGYHLVQNSSPATPNWSVVTNSPIVTNGLNEVIFTPTPSDTRFFRLQSP